MSDVGINITPWAIALGLLAIAFWPLTLAAAASLLWLRSRRASTAARMVAGGALLLWSTSALTNIAMFLQQAHDANEYRASLRARQTTLVNAAVIDGMHLPAGTVVTRSSNEFSNDVAAVDVPHAVALAGIPIVGHAGVAHGKPDGEVSLAKDVRIGEAWCSSKQPARFDSGALIECTLAQPSRIRGVPCTGAIDLQNGVVCTLASSYRRYGIVWQAQTKVTDFGDLVWFHINGAAPDLRLFGLQLPADAEVQFQNGAMASIDVRSKPVSFRGCDFDLILVRSGTLFGQTTGVCNLPTVPPNGVVLPASSVTVRS
ncbi:MAG: hypothetical protein JO146_01845 [Candidatus Eremiobacteraeota bacterium]|nr:hypothetical protein [Candidatus Eremiobacteraeota bacterium]